MYFGSYLILTVQGGYRPATYGLGGVKSYDWAPKGFASEDGVYWNFPLMYFYAPLYLADRQWWHDPVQTSPSKWQ